MRLIHRVKFRVIQIAYNKQAMKLYVLILLQILSCLLKMVNGITYEPSVCVKEYQVNYVPVDEFGHTFEEIVEYSNILADKTLLIKAIIESNHTVFLITLPEKWGKSINLMMLKTFFGVAVYSDGAIKYRETTWSYQYFKKGLIPINFRDEPTNLLSPPLISKYETIIEDYLGKYPVIYLNFTYIDGWTERNFDGYFRAFKQIIGRCFDQHNYLVTELREKINHTDEHFWCPQDQVKNVMNQVDRYIWEEENDKNKILGSMQFLSDVLRRRFGKPVVILVDNYDHPFNQMYIRYDFPSKEMKTIKKFYFQFLERTLRNNTHLFKGMIVGELNLAGCTHDSDLLAYAKEHTVLDNELYPFYGLMKPEVEELRAKARIASKHSSKANKRYSGYKVGNASAVIYNMWSVARFLNKRRIRNYWKKTEGNYEFFSQTFRFKEIRNVFKSLLVGNSVTIRCQYMRFDHEHILPLKRTLNSTESSTINRRLIDLILQYFLAYGYLTLATAPTPPTITLKLPNAEIEREIAKELHHHYSNEVGFNLTYMANNESLKLIKLIEDDENSTLGLVTLFTKLFQHSDMLEDPPKAFIDSNGTSIANNEEDAAYSLLYLLALQTKIKKNIDIISETSDKKASTRDIVLSNENKALIIRLTYRNEATSSLQKQYEKFFKTNKVIKKAKFIKIIVFATTKITIESGVLNIT